MATRDQLVQRALHALIDLIAEENETPAGELPPKAYIERIKHTRETDEAERVCRYCRSAAEHLEDYDQ